MRNQKDFNKIVGINTDNELVVCEYVFDDGFKGAVGYTMRSLYQEEIDSMKDNIDPEEMMESFIAYIKENRQYNMSLNDFIDMCQKEAEDEGRYCVWDDPSYRDEIKEMIEKLSETNKAEMEKVFGNDVVDWSVGSGGRCLDRQEYKVVFEPEIVEIIKEYEKEN